MDASTKTTGRVTPWNKGKLLGQKPPLKLKAIWAIRIRLQLTHRHREVALFNLAVDSKLRGCDLVGLHVYDVVQGSHVAPRAIVMRKKRSGPCKSRSPSKRVTLVLGHTKLESTVRYLGIEVDDALEMAEQTEV